MVCKKIISSSDLYFYYLFCILQESESESEMEEAATIEFCTQMALAGLMGSQEDLDITTELNWEEATEGMASQGFIISSHGTKTPHDSDSSSCKVSKNDVDIEEAMEKNLGDLTDVYNVEEDCATFIENKEDISLSTKGSLESVISVHPQFNNSFELEKKSSGTENKSFDFSVNSGKTKPPKIIRETSNNTNQVNSDVNECENTEEKPENTSLRSLGYGKEDIYILPTRNCFEYGENNLATSGMESTSKNLTSVSDGKENNSSLKTGLVLEHKMATCPLVEETLQKNYDSRFNNDCIIRTLIQNWSDLLKSGRDSDVTITTLEGSVVQAHSLVLLARCPELYKESMEHGKLLKWNKVPENAVHQFLSYLYTGTCEITTPGDPLWIELYDIGLQYDCKDLVAFMDLLYKAKNTPMKILVKCPQRDEEPVCLEKYSRTGKNSSFLKRDLTLSMTVKKDEFDSAEELKCTSHCKEKLHGQNESSYAIKFSQDCLKLSKRKQDKSECLEHERTQSPDLFDESLCAEKSCIISPVLNSPLAVVPNHSPSMEINQLEPVELEEISNVLPTTSSPCKSVSSLGNREDIEILPISSHTSILPTTSKKVLENYSDIPDLSSFHEESKAKSNLSTVYDACKKGDYDNDVIDLTQSESKCPSEESVLDSHVDGNCQAETESKNCADKVDSKDNENEPESDILHSHYYISDIWNDFVTDSPMTVTEELHSSFDKLAAITDKKSSIDETDSQISILGQSTNHEMAPTNFPCIKAHQKEKYNDKQEASKAQQGSFLRRKSKCDVCPPSVGDTSLMEFFSGHSGEEILANAETEIEGSVAVCESRNQTESSSTAAHVSYSFALTPRQKHKSERKMVTPKPDYSKMKSPELKVR